jgi:glyoxylase-like metal-dependent hydrolase (beta-lactamase superfamily II)
MSIHALSVEAPGRRIIVDTCLGNDKKDRRIPSWNDRQGLFLEDLAAAGFARETIDTVLCTHLHVDHVGWNTMLLGGQWLPTFPNARYLFGRVEYEHWSTQTERADMLPSLPTASGRSSIAASPNLSIGTIRSAQKSASRRARATRRVTRASSSRRREAER